jgi:DNA-binding NarL/FixJ family response regulator
VSGRCYGPRNAAGEHWELPMVSILLADDHDVMRRGLRHLVEEQPGWKVCAEATTGRQAVELAKQHKPDVAVLDITMPELNGLEATRQIRKALPNTEVLIFTMHESEELVRDAFAAGARGYLLKIDAGQDIVAAVEALFRHKLFLSSNVSEAMLDSFLRTKAPEEVQSSRVITGREREIIQLLAEGKSNKKISTMLGISVRTVETHRGSIMRKLGAKSIVDIVRYAVRNKIAEA